MMPGKRALVVDDSKSARVVLSRMLERYGIEVDSAESAESALEYLKDRRPDVIFMDHLMPGMDGLQAVRHIKSKPELSAIPIMMYTSQEGEIYGGQARASGAVGVLPKSIRPIDVTKALYQLQLLPDRRDDEPSGLEAVDGRAAPRERTAAAPVSIENLFKEQNLELRRFIISTLETWTHRIVGELRAKVPDEAEEPECHWHRSGAALAALALGHRDSLGGPRIPRRRAALLAGPGRDRAGGARIRGGHGIERDTDAGDREMAHRRRRLGRLGGAGRLPADGACDSIRRAGAESRPASSRSARSSPSSSALRSAASSGSRSYAGSFCLASAGDDGYTLAAPASPASQCEQVGNPFDDTRGGASRQPLGFANLAASVRQRTGAAIELELVPGPRERLAVSYPPIEQATAGQWNAAAQSNNRIEISIVER